jgi:hypothetical protein
MLVDKYGSGKGKEGETLLPSSSHSTCSSNYSSRFQFPKGVQDPDGWFTYIKLTKMRCGDVVEEVVEVEEAGLLEGVKERLGNEKAGREVSRERPGGY